MTATADIPIDPELKSNVVNWVKLIAPEVKDISKTQAKASKDKPRVLRRGIAEKGGPLAMAVIGRAGRPPNADAFCSYTGLVPRASETGETDHKARP